MQERSINGHTEYFQRTLTPIRPRTGLVRSASLGTDLQPKIQSADAVLTKLDHAIAARRDQKFVSKPAQEHWTSLVSREILK